MDCSKCGMPVKEGNAFCENCGAPVSADQVTETVDAAEAAAGEAQAAAGEAQAAAGEAQAASAVGTADASVPESAEAQAVAAAEAAAAAATAAAATAAAAAAPSQDSGYAYEQRSSSTAGAQPQDGAQIPSYQQQFYQQRAEAQQNGYQTPYEQQQQQYQQRDANRVYAETTGNTRALAMCAYWGLLPLIFAWVVGEKDTNAFTRHHLNQALVCLLGTLLIMIPVIGFIWGIYMLVMIILGTVYASRSEMTELPLIGKIKILK